MHKNLINLNKNLVTDVSICIPTFQRVDPLIRSLRSITSLNTSNLKIEVMISSNSKLDDVVKEFILENFDNSKYKVSVFEQDENIGMYGNWNFLLN